MEFLSVRFLSDYPFAVCFGGKEIQMLQYMEGISSRHSDIDVGLLEHFRRGALDGVHILHLFGMSDAYKPLIATLRASRPDIRVAISPTYYMADRRLRPASLVGRMLPLPNYFTVKRDVLAIADRVLVNSWSEAAQLQTLFGRSLAPKIGMLRNAVEDDFPMFRQAGTTDSFLAFSGVEPGYFLSVAFLDPRKNSLSLIENHLATYDVTGRPLVLVGGLRYADHALMERLESLLAANPGRLVHIPFVERGSDLMRSAYLNCGGHVLVSHLETPGLSNLEARSFGKPLLVGDCLPVREYFGESVIYANPRSNMSIRRGLIALDQRVRDRKHDSSPNDQLRLSAVIDQLAELYRSLATPEKQPALPSSERCWR